MSAAQRRCWEEPAFRLTGPASARKCPSTSRGSVAEDTKRNETGRHRLNGLLAPPHRTDAPGGWQEPSSHCRCNIPAGGDK